jgi:hypothetical protein
MAQLFESDDPDASQGFKNLKAAAADSTGGQIRGGLETLWKRFEPYADKEFIKEFGRHPEERFWEMYLGVRLWRVGRRFGNEISCQKKRPAEHYVDGRLTQRGRSAAALWSLYGSRRHSADGNARHRSKHSRPDVDASRCPDIPASSLGLASLASESNVTFLTPIRLRSL